jgi:hypothetical protein
MSKNLQPVYRLLINNVDVTEDVSGDISFESSPDVVSSLNFMLSGGSYLSKGYPSKFSSKNIVKLQDSVIFEGGSGFNGTNYAPIFRGFVKYVRPRYDDSGSVKVSVECVDYSYMSALSRNYFVYPSSNSKRSWANSSSLLLSDVVRNLAKDMNIPIATTSEGEDIRLLVDSKFSLTAPLTQKNESDWQVLRKLAKFNNCSVWVDSDGNNSFLHFVDKSFLRDSKNGSEISFLYPAREDKGFLIKDLSENQHIISNVTVDHDFANMSEVSRKVTIFDYKKGEEVTVFEAKITENGKEISRYYTFEIDEEKVRSLSQEKRRELEDIAGSIAGGEANGFSINDIAPYFIPAKFIDERRNFLVDKPYFGITINFTVDGNVRIVPRKNYMIYGLGRYGSETIKDSFYCRTVRHTWGTSGFLTECEFIK